MADRTAEILPTHTAALFNAAVERASAAILDGQPVVLPTETVYGLAANALDPKAVARIYEIKGRPAHNPIIVHVVGLEMARQCVSFWPPAAEDLARAFWPGPLTLVLPRSPIIPDIVTAGGATVGVRWPSHPFIQAVIRRCGVPLAAPSANPSNQLSPTNARHVERSLGRRVALIVDGGQSQVGIESTVVDLSRERWAVLRPGMIHVESLQAALTAPVADGGNPAGATEPLRSPGLLQRHYSPRARLRVLSWTSDADLRSQLSARSISSRSCHVMAHSQIPAPGDLVGVSVIPHDAEAYARALYAELHRCDELGVETIVVEALPEGPEWKGIADRLQRAAAQGSDGTAGHPKE